MHIGMMSNKGVTIDGDGGQSKEEEDIMGRNIKKMPEDMPMQDAWVNDGQLGTKMGAWKDNAKKKEADTQTTQESRQIKVPPRTQISYKAMLIENEEKAFDKILDRRMKEWLKEEEATLKLTEEQKKMIGMLLTLNVLDEKLKDLCRLWKDALILTILGRKTNLDMLKDRIKWLSHSKNFEFIDLPNNYFVFKMAEEAYCNKLLFDGPWLI
ncbi:hypothetical protein K1719_036790 [Acacia pycnantha]|nr:hypothetical protein K1719_036790 [Acacia pycnantha]